MKKIPLTRGQVALVDDEDFDYLNQWKWFASFTKGKFYAVRNVPNRAKRQKMIRMNRILMDAKDGYEIDHVDGNSLNNQRANLRACSHKENSRNKKFHSKNTSGFKGVTWHKGERRWRAQIGVNYKKIVIGRFLTVEDAALAYDGAAKRFFGEFALTNFPS